MRTFPLTVSPTEAVHIYSNAKRIWLQLRRNVPTLEDISAPSFKAAVGLSREQAIALASELLKAAALPQQTVTPKSAPPTIKAPPKPTTPPARTLPANSPANHGKSWTTEEANELINAYENKMSIEELAKAHQRTIGAIEARLSKDGKLAPEQCTIFTPKAKPTAQ